LIAGLLCFAVLLPGRAATAQDTLVAAEAGAVEAASPAPEEVVTGI